jgi:hypothetical protein
VILRYRAAMPRKPKLQPDDPEQLKRFKAMAREVGAGEHPERFDRVLERVARSGKAERQRPERQRSSRAPHSPRKG